MDVHPSPAPGLRGVLGVTSTGIGSPVAAGSPTRLQISIASARQVSNETALPLKTFIVTLETCYGI